MRVPLIALAAFLFCASSACKRSADPQHIATVDSLIIATDSLIQALRAVDIDRVRSIDSSYGSRSVAVAQRMRDTLRKEDALALANYHRTMSKYAGRSLKWHTEALGKLDVNRTQLMNLHNDLDKGLLEPVVATKYVNDERMAFAQVRQEVEQALAGTSCVIRDDAAYRSTVDSLLATDTIPVP